MGDKGTKSKNERKWGTNAILGSKGHRKSRFWFWGTTENVNCFRGIRDQVSPPHSGRASLVCSMCAVCRGWFMLPLGVIGRLRPVIVTLPGYFLYFNPGILFCFLLKEH